MLVCKTRFCNDTDSFVTKCMLRATTFLGFSVSLYLHFHSFVTKGSKNLRGKLFTCLHVYMFFWFSLQKYAVKKENKETH